MLEFTKSLLEQSGRFQTNSDQKQTQSYFWLFSIPLYEQSGINVKIIKEFQASIPGKLLQTSKHMCGEQN